LNKTEDKESYLTSISNKDVKRVEEEIKDNTEKDMFGGDSLNMGTLTGAAAKRGSVKVKPSFKRKKVLPKLKRLIEEYYKLDDDTYPNAKIAFARVLFECVLKYVVEETEYKNKKLRNFSHFDKAYKYKGRPLPYTNFAELKKSFVGLVVNVGKQNAFNQFDLDKLNQVIHNYNHGAGPGDSRNVAENLIILIEFMLQDEKDLFNSIDKSKLI
jgi:hypothetical protein